MQNPKLEGSNIVDCIPQTGQCPNDCAECYYNDDRFYRTKSMALIPTEEEVGDKIVRVNSGHDSNIERERVLLVTKRYKDKFYNTSIPKFDFPGPVMFTCNGRELKNWFYAVTGSVDDNIMAVRYRTTIWNSVYGLRDAVIHYHHQHPAIPMIITPMRFKERESINPKYLDYYEEKKHILNSWWIPNKKAWDFWQFNFHPTGLIRYCGSYESGLCKDCGNCEEFYLQWKERHDEQV